MQIFVVNVHGFAVYIRFVAVAALPDRIVISGGMPRSYTKFSAAFSTNNFAAV